MTKRRNNIHGLMDILENASQSSQDATKSEIEDTKKVVNPAIAMATNTNVQRATSIKENVLHLAHDQVRLFKYHDRHISSLDSAKVGQIRKSIEADGQHFPGIVRKTTDVTSDGRVIYELIVGRLRYEASRGVGVFKAFLKDLSDTEATKLMFSENEDRQDITPFERWLSVLPLIEDNIMGVREIADLIGWDPGNLSRSLKAKRVYKECNLHEFLHDVAKVKLSALVELSSLYEDSEEKVKNAIEFIENKDSNRKDNLFLKSVIKKVKEIKNPDSETLYLDGSQVKIKMSGNAFTMTFKGLPQESQFDKVIEQLKILKALR